MAERRDYLIVAAIDFGTTFSGYAFSFLHDYQRDPLKVCANNWTATSGNLISQKTPTCALYEPNGKFHSFGFEAEDKYGDLALDNEHHDWYYFRRFKMKLYETKGLNRDFKLEADNKKKMPALKVFSSSIKYLKDHMMTTCKNQMTDVQSDDIRWVLTVPAIWSDASKQFMREAAEKAGIPGEQLMIALEPEAASLYCKHIPVAKSEEGFSAFKPGSKYLVLDAGGGTIDITVHEVQRDGNLREIHKANGGDWGGTKVDDAFRILLSGIVGNSAFDAFCHDNKADMLEMYRDFEVKKRTIKPEGDDKINFKIPMKLNECCQSENDGKDVSSVVKSKQRLQGKLSVTGDKLRSDAGLARGLFLDAANKIVDHLKQLLRDPDARGVRSILMVGGFSESLMLQSFIKKNFRQLRMIVPQDAGLAVLKGAVIYGHEPRTIKSRVSKFTYGIRTHKPFDPEIHPVAKKTQTSRGLRCKDCFDTHVDIGEHIAVGQPQTSRNYNVLEPDQTAMDLTVYVAKTPNHEFVTDPGCIKLGTLTVDMPDTWRGLDRSVTVQMTFSGTELEVEAVNDFSGETVKAVFDFLE